MFAAGCSGTSDEGDPPSDDNSTPTEEETKTPEETDSDDEPTDTEDEGVDRPANYRWDLFPERNQALRDELGQYSEVDVGGLVEDHLAFEYSTDSERDNHGIDFNALKLYRESNYDILTRTALEYNENDANFQDLWDYANLTQQLFIREGNYVLDTLEEDDNYEGVFDGGIAVYEVDDEGVVDDVWADKAGEYDNFGQNYDELETPS